LLLRELREALCELLRCGSRGAAVMDGECKTLTASVVNENKPSNARAVTSGIAR
jgi:hypothetical protein